MGVGSPGTNPTLSANPRPFICSNLRVASEFQRAIAGNENSCQLEISVKIFEIRPIQAAWVLSKSASTLSLLTTWTSRFRHPLVIRPGVREPPCLEPSARPIAKFVIN